MLNLIKKSKKLIIKGALKLNVFLVLFSLFFSSLALTATVSVEISFDCLNSIKAKALE